MAPADGQSGDDGRARLHERDLLLRARAGEERAFDQLVALHGKLVLGLARRILPNRHDAEDVAQEVFLRLFRTLERIDCDRPLAPWLARVALNLSKNHRVRSPSRRETVLEEELAGRSQAPAIEGRLVARDRQAALIAAAESLPERQREVFILRDLQGLEASTVAQALRISPVTVRRMSTEARRRILEWIRRERPELLER